MTAAEQLVHQATLLLEQERQLKALQEDMDGIKQRNLQADLELMNLPEPPEAKDRTPHQNLVDFINKIAWRNGTPHINLWRNLYKEYAIRYETDLRVQSKIYNMNKITYAEKFGHIENLYALAIKLYAK